MGKYLRPLLIATFLSIFIFFFYLSDIKDYGVTWDEFFHRNIGKMYFNFLKTGNMEEILTNDVSPWFPPIAVTIGYSLADNSYLQAVYPLEVDRFHLAAVMFGAVTVGIAYLISYYIFRSLFLAFISSAVLALHPQFITHAHNNIRDMGLVAFYSLSILFFILTVRFAKSKWWLLMFFISGAAVGITVDVKQNGAFLYLIGLMWFIANYISFGWRKLVMGITLFTVGTGISFLSFWPYLWVDTFSHLKAAWAFLTTPAYIVAIPLTFYDQVYVSLSNIPVYYPFVMLFLLTPVGLAIMAVLGFIITAVLGLIKKRFLVLLLWFMVPLSRFFVARSSVSYDQIRHFLEVLPVFCIFSIIPFYFLWNFKPRKVLRTVVVGVSVSLVFSLIYIYGLYRPYATAYFNRLAGNPNYVTYAFDVEFWGSVYRLATMELNGRYPDSVRYYSGGLGHHLFVENGLKGYVTDEFKEDFDYAIFMNKESQIRPNAYLTWLVRNKKPIYTIEREGVVIFYQFLPHKEDYLSH